jgi:hypothetical protein
MFHNFLQHEPVTLQELPMENRPCGEGSRAGPWGGGWDGEGRPRFEDSKGSSMEHCEALISDLGAPAGLLCLTRLIDLAEPWSPWDKTTLSKNYLALWPPSSPLWLNSIPAGYYHQWCCCDVLK